MRTSKLIFLALLLSMVTCVSCVADGVDEYALWDKYTHPDGRFSFRYMSPPWGAHSDSTDEHPVMVVGSLSETTSGGLGSKMRLEAWCDDGLPALDAAAGRMYHWHSLGYDVEGVYDFANYAGDPGYSIKARFELDRVREIFFEQGGGTVSFSVWSHGDDSSDDISLLIESFEPGDVGVSDE